MPTQFKTDAWFAYRRPRPGARLRLFCLPYAGGSASIFRLWPEHLPAEVDVLPVQYPGRESRLSQAPLISMTAMADQLAAALRPYLDLPFAFFGHSLGGILGYETARRLRAESQPQPLHLFASGARAPHLPDPDPPIHHLPDAEFVAELHRLNGTPELVLQNAELMQLLMPVLRADFQVIETYRCVPGAPLNCPISVFGGSDDPELTRDDLLGWREQTTASFTLRLLAGDHFFLHSSRDVLLQLIAQELQAIIVTLKV
jgi:medium-chain acyl-[acyl-carrier-protein] hydrolase